MGKRTERFRIVQSKKFDKSLMKVKEDHDHLQLIDVHQMSEMCQKCTVKFYDQLCKVIIRENPFCLCPFFTCTNKKQLETCMHIIWVLLKCQYITLTRNVSTQCIQGV